MLICIRCGESKPDDQFYKKQARWCKDCRNEYRKQQYKNDAALRAESSAYMKEWRKKNPGYSKKYYHESGGYERHLMRKYGITLLEYNQMAARQDYRCAICGSDDTTLDLDHSHETGKNRGLLCGDCNKGIGLLKDNPAVLVQAAHYVDSFSLR